MELKYKNAEKEKYSINKWLNNVVADKMDLENNLEFRKYQKETKAKKTELKQLINEINQIHLWEKQTYALEKINMFVHICQKVHY